MKTDVHRANISLFTTYAHEIEHLAVYERCTRDPTLPERPKKQTMN